MIDVQELLPPMGMIQGFIDTTIWLMGLPWIDQLVVSVDSLSWRIDALEWQIAEKNLINNEECMRP